MTAIAKAICPRLLFSLLVFSVVTQVSFGAPGRAAAAEPEGFLRSFAAAAVATLNDRSLSQDDKARSLRRLLDAGFHLPAIGRFVLGTHWANASQQERREYGSLFADYVAATYLRRLDSIGEANLTFGTARFLKDGDLAVIASRVARSGQSDMRVDWRLKRTRGGWRILDVVVEGVSMALTLRAEFDAVIRKRGGQLPALLDEMRGAIVRQQSASYGGS